MLREKDATKIINELLDQNNKLHLPTWNSTLSVHNFHNELIKTLFSFFKSLQTTHQHHRPKVHKRTWRTRIARMLSTIEKQSPRLLHFSVAELKPCPWPQRPLNRTVKYSQNRILCTAAKNSSQFETTLCIAVSNFWQFGTRLLFHYFLINLFYILDGKGMRHYNFHPCKEDRKENITQKSDGNIFDHHLSSFVLF